MGGRQIMNEHPADFDQARPCLIPVTGAGDNFDFPLPATVPRNREFSAFPGLLYDLFRSWQLVSLLARSIVLFPRLL